MITDAELLRRYAMDRDERAFRELVDRHLGLVYGAALRRSGGRGHQAQEISQKVFTDLARKAAALSHHPALAGWLHRTTRYAAIDAIRVERRTRQLSESLAAMPDTSASSEKPTEWERLRPEIDAALDELKESDREAALLRFFEGLSYAEVGARLGLSENAARMRTERALDKLRAILGRRGVTSTSAALGLLLANQAAAAAPAGLAASVTTTAMAATPATSGIVTFLLMNKIAIPTLSAVIASGITALVWTSAVPSVSAEELAALRAENTRLTEATAADAPAEKVAAVANEYSTQAAAIAQAMAERKAAKTPVASTGITSQSSSASPEVTPRGHRNHGNATAHDAAMTFAWAGDVSDPDELGKLVYFGNAERARAVQIWNTMPETIRMQYPTPEAFYGLLLAASTLEAPPPGADVIEQNMVIVELQPGRVAMRRKGSDRNFHEYQLTETGWKHVLPMGGVEGLPTLLNSETLAKLANH